MLPRERVETAIRLGVPDRVPVIINGEAHFARLAGISPVEVYGTHHRPPFNMEPTEAAFKFAWDYYGGWDAMWRLYVGYFIYSAPCPPQAAVADIKLPGLDYPADSQAFFEMVEDAPIMDENGYDLLLEEGWFRFLNVRKMGIVTTLLRPFILREEMERVLDYWCGRGLTWWTIGVRTPIENLSYMRGLRNFLLDVHRRPEKIKAVCEASVEGYIATTLRQARRLRRYTNLIGIMCHRGGNTYYSPRRFEELYLPNLKRMVNAFTAEGFDVYLHMDSDFTLNLPYFRELPKGKVVMELDGTTDIFKAKEAVGDHLCIKGDVPATLLALASPLEVEKYCKRLIDKVGEGGGFILSNGCEVPINAKPENVKALLNTAKTYGVYRR